MQSKQVGPTKKKCPACKTEDAVLLSDVSKFLDVFLCATCGNIYGPSKTFQVATMKHDQKDSEERDYFSEEEMQCRCGCGLGKGNMNPELLRILNYVRHTTGIRMPITSAIRCEQHNNKVSNTGFIGPHVMKNPLLGGCAVDIQCSGVEAFDLLKAFTAIPEIRGIGISQRGEHSKRFIHVDTIVTGNRPWIWSY
jgi:hypothetical protein